MRKWLAVGVALAVVVMCAHTSASAGRMVLKGVITNWRQVKDKVAAKAYFQLVQVQEKMTGNTDKEGLAALTSELPKIPVRNNGGFTVNLADVPPGDYLIALQRGLASTPIVVKDGKPLIIKVPGDFPLNVGKVQLEIR